MTRSTEEKLEILENAFLKLQRPVVRRNGVVAGYDPATTGIEEISIGETATGRCSISVVFDDNIEWLFVAK